MTAKEIKAAQKLLAKKIVAIRNPINQILVSDFADARKIKADITPQQFHDYMCKQHDLYDKQLTKLTNTKKK